MAIVNPQVQPTNDPDYLKLSKPIGDIPVPAYNLKGDESSKYALGAAGDAIAGVAEIGDKVMKDVILDDAHKQYDPISDQYTAQLAQARAQITNPSATMPNTDIIPTEGTASTNIPPGLASGLDKVRSIGNAAKDPKVTDTLYLGRMDAVLKNLRAQYPGYVDYVDKVSQQVTGKNIANEYRDSMVKDLNIALSGIASQRNELQKLWDQNIDVLDPSLHDKWLSGQMPDNQAWTYIHTETAKAANVKARIGELSLMTQGRAAQQDTAVDISNSIVGDMVTKSYSNMRFNGQNNTPQDVASMMQMAKSGQFSINDAQARQLGEQMDAFRLASWTKSNYELRRPRDELGGQSLANIMGPAKTNEVLDGNHKLFDEVNKAIYSKDSGTAYAHFNQAEAITNQSRYYVLSDKTIGSYMQRIAALQAIGGPLFMQEAVKQGMTNGIDKKAVPLFTDEKINSALQPDLRQGRPSTLAGALDNGQRQGVTDPKYYQSLTDIVNDITNPNATPEVKKNAATFAFDPANRGVLQKYPADYVDPVTNKPVNGRYKAFAVLTDPKITKSLHDLNDPQSWNNYKGMAQNEFMHSIVPAELNNIRDMQNNQKIALSWNSKTNRLGVMDLNTGQPPAGGVANVNNRTVNNLNWAIAHIEQIHKADGTDTNLYMQNLLAYYGFKAKQNAEVGHSNYAEEKKPDNSVQAFVLSPNGEPPKKKVFNYSDEDLLSVTPQDIPEGMSPQEFLNAAKQYYSKRRGQ